MDSVDTLVAPVRHSHPPPGADSLVHGRYRLRERLGAGGFGVVWRAEDELLHREVALKRIPLPPGPPSPEGDGGLQAGERAGREALAAARLGHPAIVALYEAYVDGDAFHLISELVHGDTLAQLIASGELSDERILQIGLALAGALAHAHARGVIHRDVKPQNVLVPRAPAEHDTPAKLTDFGGARLVGEDVLTRTGETLGTLAYMAPEQSEGHAAGEQADVYSLALVLYEALVGANPLRGPTPAATARRIGRPVPPLQSRRPDLPRALCGALDTALEIDPDRRATLQQLHAALEQALAQGPRSRRGPLRRRPVDQAPGQDSDAPAVSSSATRLAPVRAPASPSVTPLREPLPDPRPSSSSSDAADNVAAAERPPLGDRFAPPRAIWLGGVLAVAAWQAVSGRPGLALLLLALAAPLLFLGRRPGAGLLAGALAPLLGLVGLAGAYPALAGQAARWSRRAALGALGYFWLILSEPLLAGGSPATHLWLGPPSGTPPRAIWEHSLDAAAMHVLAPALTLSLVLGAALWAAGAAVLPWIVRGRNAVLDTVLAVTWSAALCAAAPVLDAGLSSDTPLLHPRGAVLGAVLGGAVAIAARALRGPV
ncbi:MAG TPA: serine/threonine-protein kinase [Solirubrobacteraceae bacterium]|nr:serine/threonine-protein kinase [Solirubrobacteraceae bacterium]